MADNTDNFWSYGNKNNPLTFLARPMPNPIPPPRSPLYSPPVGNPNPDFGRAVEYPSVGHPNIQFAPGGASRPMPPYPVGNTGSPSPMPIPQVQAPQPMQHAVYGMPPPPPPPPHMNPPQGVYMDGMPWHPGMQSTSPAYSGDQRIRQNLIDRGLIAPEDIPSTPRQILSPAHAEMSDANGNPISGAQPINTQTPVDREAARIQGNEGNAKPWNANPGFTPAWRPHFDPNQYAPAERGNAYRESPQGQREQQGYEARRQEERQDRLAQGVPQSKEERVARINQDGKLAVQNAVNAGKISAQESKDASSMLSMVFKAATDKEMAQLEGKTMDSPEAIKVFDAVTKREVAKSMAKKTPEGGKEAMEILKGKLALLKTDEANLSKMKTRTLAERGAKAKAESDILAKMEAIEKLYPDAGKTNEESTANAAQVTPAGGGTNAPVPAIDPTAKMTTEQYRAEFNKRNKRLPTDVELKNWQDAHPGQ